jgi:hypothetical protein
MAPEDMAIQDSLRAQRKVTLKSLSKPGLIGKQVKRLVYLLTQSDI